MDGQHDKQVLNTPQDYVDAVVTLKKSNKFEAADALVLEGLEKFQKEAGLYIEYGDIAVRQKNWREAVKRWVLMREKCPGHPKGYIEGSKALKEHGDFAAAEALVREGLEKFPREAGLYIEYGDIAARQKNWPEAAKRWELMREKCPEHIRGYIDFIIALKESKEFEFADALTAEGTGEFTNETELYMTCQKNKNETIKDFSSKADSFMLKESWSSALRYYLEAVKFETKRNMSHIRKLKHCFSKLGFVEADIQQVLNFCCIDESIYINEIKNMIFNSDIENILAVIENILQGIIDNSDAKQLWKESFTLLLESVKCSNLSTDFESDIDFNNKINKLTTLIVSGMGWSGSGAIICYLSEFNEINKNVIFRESPMIEGEFGLKDIVDNINSRESFIFSVFDFVFLHLLGVFPYSSLNHVVSAKFAIEYTKDNQLEHAKKCGRIVRKLAFLIYNYNRLNKIEILKTIGKEIINFYVKNKNNEDSIILLCDNIIHIRNIELINYIDDVHIFCCVRDPRSHYIALKNEYPSFNHTIDSYISMYKRELDKFDENLSKISNNSSHVYKIQFEKFILSECYRKKEVLNKIHPNLTHTKRYSRFKPWESIFNVLNYIQYENQEEIEFLHNKLSEYCIDIKKEYIIDTIYDCALENERLQSIIAKKEGKPSESNFGLRRWNKSTDII